MPEPDRSGGRSRQPDERIIADGRDAFQRDVAGALDGLFVALLELDGADEACDGGFVGEDADDFGTTLDLAVEPFQRVCRMKLGAMLGGDAHVGEHVGLGLVHQGGELGDLRSELVSDTAPLSFGLLGIVLGEGGGDER